MGCFQRNSRFWPGRNSQMTWLGDNFGSLWELANQKVPNDDEIQQNSDFSSRFEARKTRLS